MSYVDVRSNLRPMHHYQFLLPQSSLFSGNIVLGTNVTSTAISVSGRLAHADGRGAGNLQRRLDRLAVGPDAPLCVATAEQAKALVGRLPGGLPLPQVVPSVDGDVLFLWYHGGNQVQANLDPDGHLAWFGQFDGSYQSGDDIRWRGDVPSSLNEMLARLFR